MVRRSLPGYCFCLLIFIFGLIESLPVLEREVFYFGYHCGELTEMVLERKRDNYKIVIKTMCKKL